MRRALKKKNCSCCEGFCGHACIRLIGLDIFVERASHKQKSHADLMSQHILEQMNREEKTHYFFVDFWKCVEFVGW